MRKIFKHLGKSGKITAHPECFLFTWRFQGGAEHGESDRSGPNNRSIRK